MKIIQCQFCKHRGLICEDMEFDRLREGRFRRGDIPEMIKALQQALLSTIIEPAKGILNDPPEVDETEGCVLVKDSLDDIPLSPREHLVFEDDGEKFEWAPATRESIDDDAEHHRRVKKAMGRRVEKGTLPPARKRPNPSPPPPPARADDLCEFCKKPIKGILHANCH